MGNRVIWEHYTLIQLEPQSGTTLTVGETGQNTVVGGNTIKLNTLKDAGGNTIINIRRFRKSIVT